MHQSAERTVILGDTLPIGVALVQRLLQLGHPRSELWLQSTHVGDGAEWTVVRHFVQDAKPERVYFIDPQGCCEQLPSTAPTVPGAPATASPCEWIDAVAAAGVPQFMYVATTPAALPLQRCASYAAQGLDYRSVRTCQPYGPYRPHPLPSRVGRAARIIEQLLQQFSAAVHQHLDHVVIPAAPDERLELMYLNDLAEALVFVAELPRAELASATPPPGLHIDIGAEDDVCLLELVEVTAHAAGFRGRIALEQVAAGPAVAKLDNRPLARLGWRPLIPLDIGLELSAMDFRLRQRISPTSPTPSAPPNATVR